MAKRHIDTARTSSTTFVQFVKCRGSGVLNGLAVAGGIGYHYFQITLDGQQLPGPVNQTQPADSFLAGILGGPGHGNNGFTVGLDFEHDLLVEIRSSLPSPQTIFWASYTLEPMADVGPTGRIEEAGGVPHLFRSFPGGRVLVGPARWSRVKLRNDFWLPGEPITGEVELHADQAAEVPFEETVPLVLRPAGRTRRFEPVLVLIGVRRHADFEISPDFFEARGDLQFMIAARRDLELVADLPGYANYPASLV